MKVYHDHDADLGFLAGKTVAVLGFGSQGHAHALNLKDSGVSVVVGLRPGSTRWGQAEARGLKVRPVAEAVAEADVVMVLLPDEVQARVYREAIEPNLKEGAALAFAHGFNIHFGQIRLVRSEFEAGRGVPALVAIHQDKSGAALPTALGYAKAIGATRAGVIPTTFAEETETDLFGEQAVLAGGLTRLIAAGFETLVEAGYQPEIAYFETLHEVKLIVDLIYEAGLAGMRYSISNTAEYGDYTRGDAVIGPEVKERMREVLRQIQEGAFAREWILENQAGRPVLEAGRRRWEAHPIEEVGKRLRAMMPFIKARFGEVEGATD